MHKIACSFRVHFRICFRLYRYNHDGLVWSLRTVSCNVHDIFVKYRYICWNTFVSYRVLANTISQKRTRWLHVLLQNILLTGCSRDRMWTQSFYRPATILPRKYRKLSSQESRYAAMRSVLMQSATNDKQQAASTRLDGRRSKIRDDATQLGSARLRLPATWMHKQEWEDLDFGGRKGNE